MFSDTIIDLKLVIQCNFNVLHCLVVTLNLTDSTYQIYHKPNDEIYCIHKKSNHPPSVIR